MVESVPAATIPTGQRRKLRVKELNHLHKSVSGGTKVGTKGFCLLIQDSDCPKCSISLDHVGPLCTHFSTCPSQWWLLMPPIFRLNPPQSLSWTREKYDCSHTHQSSEACLRMAVCCFWGLPAAPTCRLHGS